MPLHIVVKVPSRWIDQPAVVVIAIPIAHIVMIRRFGSPNHYTPVWSGNEVIIVPAAETECIRRPQMAGWRFGCHNVTACASYGNNPVPIFWGNGGCVCVAGEDDPFCSDFASGSCHSPASVVVWPLRYRGHRCMCLQIYTRGNCSTQELRDQFIRP